MLRVSGTADMARAEGAETSAEGDDEYDDDAVVLSLCDFLACGGERMEVITSPLCHRFAAHCCRRGSCALRIAGARR